MGMKGKRLIFTLLIVFFIITSIQALWHIDIVISALMTQGTLISLVGKLDLAFVYHSALLRVHSSVIALSFLSVYFFVKSSEKEIKDTNKN